MKLTPEEAAHRWLRGSATTQDIQIMAEFIAKLRQPDPLAEAMGEALRPFSIRADYFDRKIKECGELKDWDENTYYVDDPPSDIYIKQLREARAAIAAYEQEAMTDKIDQPEQPMSARAWHCEVRIPSYTPEPASMTYALAEGYAAHITAELRQQLADKELTAKELATVEFIRNVKMGHSRATAEEDIDELLAIIDRQRGIK